MVLLFLRDLRSALIVVLTIPFSLLAAFGRSASVWPDVNIMTLGGLALAVGILVDEGTIAIENIHVHLESAGPRPARSLMRWVKSYGRASSRCSP